MRRNSGSAGEALAGLATRPAVRRGALVTVSIAGATLALSGCTAPDDGIVLTGADGKEYVLPEDAERPQYDSKEDCIADITERIRILESQGEEIADSPEDLCESSEGYRGAYAHPWLGPILFFGNRWSSNRVAGWSSVGNGGFAAPGAYLPPDVVQPAPAGAKAGQRATLKGGFGATGKSGFGESAGG